MKKILLVYPSFNPDNAEADIEPEINLDEEAKVVPMGVISIAAFLEERGYQVKIIDCRFYKKEQILTFIREEIRQTDCIGISAMTAQVRHGIQICDFVRSLNENIPIVWGGMHATLFPVQTCQDEAIDYVIRGEGEYAFIDLLSYLKEGKPHLKDIKGLVYKGTNEVQMNPPTEPLDVVKLPRPAYHLLDIENYIKRKLIDGRIVRGLDILTSRGCPYRCAFCVNPFLTHRRWRAVPVERVLEDIEHLTKEYQLNNLWFMDDYFFGRKNRVKQIVEGIIARKYNITWAANIRADNFSSGVVADEFLDLLFKSGCYAFRIGAESGSNDILGLLKKDIKVTDIINAVEQCSKHGIIAMCFWMMGIPGETIDDIKQTLHLIWKLHQINPRNPMTSPGVFRPYPGGELYEKCKELGFDESPSLRAWGERNLYAGYLDASTLPWLENPRLIMDFRIYGAWVRKSNGRIHGFKSLLIRALGKLAELRYKYNYWDFRIEPRVYTGIRRIYQILTIGILFR